MSSGACGRGYKIGIRTEPAEYKLTSIEEGGKHAFLFFAYMHEIEVFSEEEKDKKKRAFMPRIKALLSYALSTLPERRQDVQTYIFLEPPSVLTRTDLMLDFHIRFERLCE